MKDCNIQTNGNKSLEVQKFNDFSPNTDHTVENVFEIIHLIFSMLDIFFMNVNFHKIVPMED